MYENVNFLASSCYIMLEWPLVIPVCIFWFNEFIINICSFTWQIWNQFSDIHHDSNIASQIFFFLLSLVVSKKRSYLALSLYIYHKQCIYVSFLYLYFNIFILIFQIHLPFTGFQNDIPFCIFFSLSGNPFINCNLFSQTCRKSVADWQLASHAWQSGILRQTCDGRVLPGQWWLQQQSPCPRNRPWLECEIVFKCFDVQLCLCVWMLMYWQIPFGNTLRYQFFFVPVTWWL